MLQESESWNANLAIQRLDSIGDHMCICAHNAFKQKEFAAILSTLNGHILTREQQVHSLSSQRRLA